MKACPQCHIRYPTDAVYCFLDGAVARGHPGSAHRHDHRRSLPHRGRASARAAWPPCTGPRHKLVDRPCAVKIMNPALASDPTTRERFRREAKSAQTLAHPNVIEIFDQGETPEGTTYIVMELLDGKTLADADRRGRRSRCRAAHPHHDPDRAAASRARTTSASSTATSSPRTSSSSGGRDGTDLVKILDFGIATLARGHAPHERRGALRHAAVPGARAHHAAARRGRASTSTRSASSSSRWRRASSRSRRATRRRSSSST